MVLNRVIGGNRTAHIRAGVVLQRVALEPAPRGVEVGVFQGKMSQALLKGHAGLYLYMVDNWLPTEEQPESYLASKDFHSKLTHKVQLQHYGTAIAATMPYRDRREIMVRSSVEAAAVFSDDACDFVFLDADHSYEGVIADIAAWWPKIKPGGWLCGHDYGGWLVENTVKKYFGVKRAIDEWAAHEGLQVTPDEDYTFFVRRPLEE